MVRRNPKRKEKCELSGVEGVRAKLTKMNYALVGETGAVQICRWTKNAIRGEGGCWKEKFYGVSSAGCCQMTPAVMWCENSCVHCWRPIELNLGTELPKIENPKELLDGIISARRELLVGFKGREGIDLKKLEEALEPKLYTMSLSGEPTLYPQLGALFKEIRRRGAVSFLVTNGLNSKAIKKLRPSELPTQITVSTNAPNEDLFVRWHRSSKKNAWKEFNKTLRVIKDLKGKVRRVIRLTLVRETENSGGDYYDLTNMSEDHVKEYAKLIRKAEPDFVHVKGFKSVGYARDRMGYDKQPWHRHVLAFSKKLEKELAAPLGVPRKSALGGKDKYSIAAEDERSCVVMLAKKGKKLKIEKI